MDLDAVQSGLQTDSGVLVLKTQSVKSGVIMRVLQYPEREKTASLMYFRTGKSSSDQTGLGKTRFFPEKVPSSPGQVLLYPGRVPACLVTDPIVPRLGVKRPLRGTLFVALTQLKPFLRTEQGIENW